VLRTNNIDHHRTGDVVTLLDALSDTGQGKLATVADLYERKAFLVLGADLALEHPLLSYQMRANYRHHQAHIYAVTPGPVREDNYAAAVVRGRDYESLREKLQKEPELVILFDDSYRGEDLRKVVAFGASLGIPVSYVRWWITPILAAPSTWGWRPNCCRDISPRASRACTWAR